MSLLLAGALAAMASGMVALVWVWYIRSLEDRRHVQAALADALIIGLSALTILAYVYDLRTLPWVMLGGASGTLIASRWLR